MLGATPQAGKVMSDYDQRWTTMAKTTIPIDPKVRDRLKTYGTKDMDYDEILQQLMDEVDRDRFVAEQRRRASQDTFVPLDEA